jgi:hypothetical protein
MKLRSFDLSHGLFLLTLTLSGVESALAEAECFWRAFDKFIRSDVLDGALEAESDRRRELDALITTEYDCPFTREAPDD